MSSELEPGASPASPAPAAAPPRERDLPRAWIWLALLLLAAAPLGAPYEAAFAGRDPAFSLGARPAVVLLSNLAETLILYWPLAWFGLRLARGIGWGAPFFDGTRSWRRTWPPLAFAACLGVCLDAATRLVVAGVVYAWPLALAAPHAIHPHIAPWKGMLAGPNAGIVEETEMRLFLMSAVAALSARVQGTPGRASPLAFWVANALAALVFGALHFSNMSILHVPFTFAHVTYVLAANGALGLLCGWLFVRYGFETAVVAHAAAGLFGHGVFPALGSV